MSKSRSSGQSTVAVVLLLATLAVAGCDGNATAPSAMNAVTIGSLTPASGATIAAPGNFIAPGSGALSIRMMVESATDLPFAQLYVYLLSSESASGYCGQNLPDAPTWRPFSRGRQAFTITGFQVSTPCQVTGIRVMFHSRTNINLLTPPVPADTVAEAMLHVSYSIQ